jgi:uncharacterized protein YbgA (DUF1722 family)
MRLNKVNENKTPHLREALERERFSLELSNGLVHVLGLIRVNCAYTHQKKKVNDVLRQYDGGKPRNLLLTISWRKRVDANTVRGPFGCETFDEVGNGCLGGIVKDL